MKDRDCDLDCDYNRDCDRQKAEALALLHILLCFQASFPLLHQPPLSSTPHPATSCYLYPRDSLFIWAALSRAVSYTYFVF